MKSVGGVLDRMLDRENLVEAARLAAKGRRERPEVRRFFDDLERQLGAIREELACGQPRCGECVRFVIHDPKRREITAPVFRERVLHHAVMRVCGPVLDARQTHHSHACRAGKGSLRAVQAAQAFARSHTWFLKCDIAKYFDSIPRGELARRAGRLFREPVVRRILAGLIHAYEPGKARGLPIGALTSQHLANFYLTPLDALVLQDLRPGGYVRYMDDFVLWAESREQLREARERIREAAESLLGLRMKEEPFINRCAGGMDFLGYRVRPGGLGLASRSRKRFRRKASWLVTGWRGGTLGEWEAQVRAEALVAFTRPARCLGWRQRVFLNLGGIPWERTASCAAATGSTTAGTAGRPTATTTIPATATTTSAFVSPKLQRGRSRPVEPESLPDRQDAPRDVLGDETQQPPSSAGSPKTRGCAG